MAAAMFLVTGCGEGDISPPGGSQARTNAAALSGSTVDFAADMASLRSTYLAWCGADAAAYAARDASLSFAQVVDAPDTSIFFPEFGNVRGKKALIEGFQGLIDSSPAGTTSNSYCGQERIVDSYIQGDVGIIHARALHTAANTAGYVTTGTHSLVIFRRVAGQWMMFKCVHGEMLPPTP
jgi:hypothetical protein